MTAYLNDFMKRYDYPSEAVDVIISAYETLKDNTDFTDLCSKFYTDITNNDMMIVLENVSNTTGINLYTVYLEFSEESEKANEGEVDVNG